MKRVILTMLFVPVLAFAQMGMDMSGSAMKGSSSMFMGYLSDVRCAESNNGVTSDGINLKLHPEKHTVACMKMAPCAMSGYGLFVKGSDGVYSFHRFDKKGIELSKDLLKKTKKKEGVSVHVTGEMKNNIIYVQTIQEM